VILEVLRRIRRKGAVTAYVDCLGATGVRELGERLAGSLLASLEGRDALDDARRMAAGMKSGRPRPCVKADAAHAAASIPTSFGRGPRRNTSTISQNAAAHSVTSRLSPSIVDTTFSYWGTSAHAALHD